MATAELEARFPRCVSVGTRLWREFASRSRPRLLRPMSQFAEEEIVLPSGPHEGRKFSMRRQPWTRLWFAEVDSGLYTEHCATGPSQSGKTLCCSVIPALYVLFELGQTYIYGIPTLEMAKDKWHQDFLPVVSRSRFADLLPHRGSSSRGAGLAGEDPAIRFANGATLKFMSGGGSDKKRAGFTSRFLGITETDGMDTAGLTSREADKISQLKARTQAFGDDARLWTECTMSIDTGYINTTYSKGTASVIEHPCPYCREWVVMERAQLVGWQPAETEEEARAMAYFACPKCGAKLSEDDRRHMNLEARLTHTRASRVLGFRWSAFQNLFMPAAMLAEEEWKALRSPHEEREDVRLKQFFWAIPIPVESSIGRNEIDAICRKQHSLGRGVVPEGVGAVTVGVDIGSHFIHWAAVGWDNSGTGAIFDYGVEEVPSRQMGTEAAVVATLRQLASNFAGGWPQWTGQTLGESRAPQVVWCDAGYLTELIYGYCRQTKGWMPVLGRGSGQRYDRKYSKPSNTQGVVRHMGDGFHVAYHKAAGVNFVEVDADRWKSFVHERLRLPAAQAGSLTLWLAKPMEHLNFARHLTAEYETQEFVVGKGVVTKWEQERKANHWLDALYYACAAASLCEVHQQLREAPSERRVASPVLRRDGRAWLSR